MKIIAIALGIVIVVGVGSQFLPDNSITVTKPETTEVIKEVTPEWASDEDAVQAAQDVIRRKELEAELAGLEEENAAIEARMTEIEKELGTYWRDVENVKALIRQTFPEDPVTAVEVARRESFGNFGMEQSQLRYPKDNPKWGVEAGDQERSYCIFQIHAPAHDANAKKLGLGDYKTNVESCIKMARVIYDDRGGFYAWTEYHKMLAMR